VSTCELLSNCKFLEKYKATMAMACQGFVKKYCQGDKLDECKRLDHYKQHGEQAVEDMLPSGRVLVI